MNLRLAVCLLAFPVGTFAQDWTSPPATNYFRAEINVAGEFGPIDGYLQTPLGGNPGTTSRHRPTFNELNIDTAASADVALTLGWGNHALVGGAEITPLSGSSVLRHPLISENVSYPAGTPVSSDVRLDWYRVGYQYRLSLADGRFELRPEIGLALFDFDYRLRGTGALATSRAYAKAAPELGLEAEWNPGGKFSLSAAARGAVPEPTGLGIVSAELTGNYQVWNHTQMFLGIGYELIDFEDHQRVPNHIYVNRGPLGLLGVRVRF